MPTLVVILFTSAFEAFLSEELANHSTVQLRTSQQSFSMLYYFRLTILLSLWTTSVASAIEPAVKAVPAAQGAALAPELSLDLGDQVALKLVLINPGTFLMGSPVGEKDRMPHEGLPQGKFINGSPQRPVTISKPFYMGIHAVTVDQFAQFAKEAGAKPKKPGYPQAGNHPVVGVNWDEADAFCKWLSKKTGKTVSLPTEAQREYACRAGTKTRFSFGNSDADLHKHENYCDKTNTSQLSKANYRDEMHSDGFDRTSPVGSFKPNPWGLYDMQGNVWEWCADWYADSYSPTDRVDPTGPAAGEKRVVRGGAWAANAAMCRAASRLSSDPKNQYQGKGFRVTVVAPAAK